MSTSGSMVGDRQRVPREQRQKQRADNNALTGVVITNQGMKLPTLLKFSGKKGTLIDFLNQTNLYMAFYHKQFSNPEPRNLFMISYLEGDAAAALRP